MDASFPLSTGTYSINGRKYRKTLYQMKTVVPTDNSCQSSMKFEDTPDVYEDEPSAGCLATNVLSSLKKKKAKIESSKKGESNHNELIATEDDRIKVSNGKKWIASIFVPACFIGKLIGTNRRALNSLENDTQCRVKTPRREENGPCEVTSIVSLECVQRCLDRIEIFIDDAKKTARVTHFVAFPCDHLEVQKNFDVFKQMIMDSDTFDKSCKNPQLFTKPSRLHLTISVARIFDDTDLQKVSDFFKVLESEIRALFGSQPLVADIQGIDMMNDDPSQVSVIYAKVNGGNIQEVTNYVSRRLVELGISTGSDDNVKLHMTLMNARYVTQAERAEKRKEMLTFDAKEILHDFESFFFGTIQFTEICLCPLSSSSSSPEGKFYEKLAIIKLA